MYYCRCVSIILLLFKYRHARQPRTKTGKPVLTLTPHRDAARRHLCDRNLVAHSCSCITHYAIFIAVLWYNIIISFDVANIFFLRLRWVQIVIWRVDCGGMVINGTMSQRDSHISNNIIYFNNIYCNSMAYIHIYIYILPLHL